MSDSLEIVNENECALKKIFSTDYNENECTFRIFIYYVR